MFRGHLLGWSILALFAVWSLAFKPALSTLRTAPEQQQQALATLERLQALAAQATVLRASAAVAGAQGSGMRTLETGLDEQTKALIVTTLGEGTRVEAQGRWVEVSFDGASGAQVRQALQTLRSRLRAHLMEAELSPASEGIRGRLRFEWTSG